MIHRVDPLSLAELQQKMIALIYGTKPEASLLGAIHSRGVPAASLLAIYRNGTRATLLQTLHVSYPVIERLVGPKFFATAGSAYIDATPSRSGDLERYGDDFGNFLGRYEPAKSFPYLEDVARLEWLVSKLQRMPDVQPLDCAQLATIPPSALADVRLSLVPRAALFVSLYPAFRIWNENRDPAHTPDRISIAEGGDRLLLIANLGVAAYKLSEAEHGFFEHFERNGVFSSAVDAALEQDPHFNFAAVLRHSLEWRCLCRSTVI